MGNQSSTSTTSTKTTSANPTADDTAVPPFPPSLEDEFHYEKGVCALEYWDPIKCLEQGSISDIHLVRRRRKRVKVRYKEKRDIMTLAKDKDCKNPTKNPTCCSNEDADNLFVLKSIMKDHVGNARILDEMRREIYTMSRLHHPNVVRLYEAYERRRHIYLVMEYCPGGNLLNRKFAEPQVAVIIGKILNALEYLHSKKVVHRDLKLENILLDKSGDIKIIDFGLATKYLSEEYQVMTDRVGTLYSMAPQVLQGVYTSKCDLWSTGVVAYMLLSHGKQPFWGPPRPMPWPERRKIMMDRILRGQYMRMDKGPTWARISQPAKDFVATLLQLDPDKRPTAEEALKDPWITKYYSPEKEAVSGTNIDTSTTSNEKDDVQTELLAKCMANVRQLLVTNLKASELVELRHAVEQKDHTGNGYIPLHEFQSVLEQHIAPPILVSEAMKVQLDGAENSPSTATLDLSANDVEYVDFFAHTFLDIGRHSTDGLAKALDDLDTKGTRTVTMDQLKTALAAHVPADVRESVLQQIKADNTVNIDAVNTSTVLELVGKKMARHMRESICNYSSHDNSSIDVDGSELLTEATAVIPGGRQTLREDITPEQSIHV